MEQLLQALLAELPALSTALERGSGGGGGQSDDDSALSVETHSALKATASALRAAAAAARAPFGWEDGPLLVAMRRGELLLVDELNLAEDAVLERLNRCAPCQEAEQSVLECYICSSSSWTCSYPPKSTTNFTHTQAISALISLPHAQLVYASLADISTLISQPRPNNALKMYCVCAVCWSQAAASRWLKRAVLARRWSSGRLASSCWPP